MAYVPVDVVVTDGDEHPVRDLNKDDFVVTDDGRAQEIADFQFVSIPLADRIIDLRAALGPPADVASNAPPARDSQLATVEPSCSCLTTSRFAPVNTRSVDATPDLQRMLAIVPEAGNSARSITVLKHWLQIVQQKAR